LAIVAIRTLQWFFPAFRRLMDAACNEFSDAGGAPHRNARLPADAESSSEPARTLAWWLAGALFLAASFAYLEIAHPYYFAQDDALVAELPGMIEGCRSVWSGVWPDYDPYRLMGGPLAGEGLFSLTYPPTYLSYAIARHLLRNEYALLDVFAALHLAAGYWAISLLCKRLGVRPMIACVAALSFLLSGSVLIMGRSWHTFVPIVVWMPLLMIAVQRLVDRPVGWTWAIGTGLAAGMLFHVGFPQVWLYAVLFTTFSLLWLLATGAISWRRLLSAWPAAVIGLGVVAPLLVPQLVATRGVSRLPPYGTGLTREWIAALLPFPLVKVAHPMGWGSTDLQYMGHFVYFGSVFAILFVIALLAVVARSSRRIWSKNVWLACALLALLLCMGDRGGLFFLLSKIPLIRVVNNNPFRALPFFVLFAVVGAAVFSERALRAMGERLRWPNAVAGLTLLLLGYHVVMARASFYTYGFKPYPPLPVSVSKRIAGTAAGRMISWTTERSIAPTFAATLPLDLPMLDNAAAFSGYDPLLQWGQSYETAERLLAEKPIETLRAYGVRWHLLSPLLRNPILSPNSNPVVRVEETAINDEAAMRAVKRLLKIIVHGEGVQLGELADVAPMAFPRQRPTLALPVTAGGDGIKVSLKRMKESGIVIVNFLWYPQMRATIDGKSVELAQDDFERMMVEMPAGAKTLHIRYAAGWGVGSAIGLALVLIGLFGCWFGGRARGLMHIDVQPPD
jgi:hypothetical protein